MTKFRPENEICHGENTSHFPEFATFVAFSYDIILEMKQNGNHHVSAILRNFTLGNLRQHTRNFNSFPAMCGMPRYDATSRITKLFPITFRMEVSIYLSMRFSHAQAVLFQNLGECCKNLKYFFQHFVSLSPVVIAS